MGHIIIVGAGEVGYHIALRLSREFWDVTIIDQDPTLIEKVANSLDVNTIVGNGSSPQILREAGIEKTKLLIAVTDSDETNILACAVANIYAPPECQKVARIRNTDYIEDEKLLRQGHLGIDFHINPERASAEKIMRLLETPQATNVLTFADDRVLLLGLQLGEDSKLFGKSFAELGQLNPEKHFLAAAMERNGTLIIPRGDDRLQPKDTIYIVTTPEDQNDVLRRLGFKPKPLESVAIFGGDRVGFFLAQQLEKQGISVRLIEPNRKRCEQLASQLHKTIVLHGDATDRALLEEENIPKFDVFVAVSDDEESNILSALLAKRLGAPKVISLVNKASYETLIRNVGVDAAISPRQLATSLILHFIRLGKVLQVDALGEEQAEAIEFLASKKAPIVNKTLAQANIPKGALIGAIVHKDCVTIAKGDTIIRENDRVIVFALQDAIAQIEKYFLSQ